MTRNLEPMFLESTQNRPPQAGDVFQRVNELRRWFNSSEFALLGCVGGPFRRTVSEGLDCCRRLLPRAGDETAAIHDKQVGNVMGAVEAVDHLRILRVASF